MGLPELPVEKSPSDTVYCEICGLPLVLTYDVSAGPGEAVIKDLTGVSHADEDAARQAAYGIHDPKPIVYFHSTRGDEVFTASDIPW